MKLKIRLTAIGAQQRRATFISRIGMRIIPLKTPNAEKFPQLIDARNRLRNVQAGFRSTPAEDFRELELFVSSQRTQISSCDILRFAGFNPLRATYHQLVESFRYED